MRSSRSKAMLCVWIAVPAALSAAFIYKNVLSSLNFAQRDPVEYEWGGTDLSEDIWQNGWPILFMERGYWDNPNARFALDISTFRSVDRFALGYNIAVFITICIGTLLFLYFHRAAVSTFLYRAYHGIAAIGWIASFYLYPLDPVGKFWVLSQLVMIAAIGAAWFGYFRALAMVVEKRFGPARFQVPRTTGTDRRAGSDGVGCNQQPRPSRMMLSVVMIITSAALLALFLFQNIIKSPGFTPDGYWQHGWPFHFLVRESMRDGAATSFFALDFSTFRSIDWLAAVCNIAAFIVIWSGMLLLMHFHRAAITTWKYRVYHLFPATGWLACYFHFYSPGFPGVLWDISFLLMFAGMGAAWFGYSRGLVTLVENRIWPEMVIFMQPEKIRNRSRRQRR